MKPILYQPYKQLQFISNDKGGKSKAPQRAVQKGLYTARCMVTEYCINDVGMLCMDMLCYLCQDQYSPWCPSCPMSTLMVAMMYSTCGLHEGQS
jgi:hypothetical protein